MRLLLDEMWSGRIASELRSRGHDVVAIVEDSVAPRYSGVEDDQVFMLAQEDGFTIVTDNVPDYEAALRTWESRPGAHHGVIYALNPPFNRHRGAAVIGEMVRALDLFLQARGVSTEPLNTVHYLRAEPPPR